MIPVFFIKTYCKRKKFSALIVSVEIYRFSNTKTLYEREKSCWLLVGWLFWA